MNSKLTKTVMEMIKIEAMNLVNNYDWKWNKEDLCFYNEYGDDIADCVYYDCDGFLIHPKVLASYVEDYLKFGEKMIWHYDLK